MNDTKQQYNAFCLHDLWHLKEKLVFCKGIDHEKVICFIFLLYLRQ